jgi:hypothetical protein
MNSATSSSVAGVADRVTMMLMPAIPVVNEDVVELAQACRETRRVTGDAGRRCSRCR